MTSDFSGLRYLIAVTGAEVLTAEGDPAGALDWGQARALATELGARELLAQVASLARLAKISLVEPAPVADPSTLPVVLAGLTGREREILRFLVVGRSNTEIETSLVISAKTVSVHVSDILRKTGPRTGPRRLQWRAEPCCPGPVTGAD